MKQKLTLLLLALFTTVGAWAETYTITFDHNAGTFYKDNAVATGWVSKWVSNEAGKPAVTITASANTINSDNGRMAPGQSQTCTYSISVEDGYVVTGFSMNCPTFGADVTVTPTGESAINVATNGTLVVNSSASSFVYSGSNSGRIQASANDGGSFKITVENIETISTSISDEAYVNVGEKVASFTAATSADDNDHWYILTQVRDGESPMYDAGTGNQLKRTAASITPNTINGTKATSCTQYLIRFFDAGEGLYNIQFANGNFITSSLKTSPAKQLAGKYAFYNTNSGEGSYFGWNLNSNTGSRVDNNGAGNTLSFWGSGTISGTSGNNVWYLYPAELQIPSTTYVYEISDASGVVFTSDPISATAGETISTLPSNYQLNYCSYTVTSTTLAPGENTVPVTVTYNLPFTASTSYNDATWYYATLRGKHLRADDNAKDGDGRYATNSTNERTDAYKWAFFGNPYTGIYVMNKNQGESKYLYKETQLVFKSGITPTSDNNALFAATPNSNGGFTLRNIGGGATWYINDAGNGGNLGFWNSSNGANDGGSNWVITEVGASDKAALGDAITAAQALVNGVGVPGYINSTAATTLTSAISTAQGIYDDAEGDYFSAYNTLTAAIATATATENINYTPRTDVYYTILNARGAMVYDPSHSSSVDATNGNAEYIWYGSTTPDATNVNNLWGFIEQEGKYYMYNVGKQQFASVGTGGYGATWIFSDTPAYITLDNGIADEIAAPKVRVRATIATTGNSYTMSVSTSYTGPVITYDANGDGGVPMLFTESSVAVDPDVTATMTAKVEDLTPYFTTLKNAIDACDEISLGTGLNQYASNDTYTSALSAANTAYNNPNSTKAELQTAVSNLEAAVNGLVLNLPSAGFYRIKGKTSGNYLAAGMANSKYAMSSATDATTIFYYDTSMLVNFSSGMANGMSTSSWSWVTGDAASTVTFADGGTKGGYTFKSSNAFFYDGGTNADRGSSLDNDEKYRSWYVEPVTSLPIRMRSAEGAYFGTINLPVAVVLPEGLMAYKASVEGEVMTLTKVVKNGVLAANTPVVLYSEDEVTELAISGESGTSVTDNKLSGTVAAEAVTAGDNYVLSGGSKGVGFYKFTGTTMPGFKAYLSSAAGVKAFSFSFEDMETAIRAIESENSGLEIYDISGRRVPQARKGLYIVNGKKVMFK